MDIQLRVAAIEKDLWKGNGKPGLCTRMEVAEGDIEAVNARCDNTDKRFDNIDKKVWAVIMIGLTILGTSVANLIKSEEHHSSPPGIHSYNE